jgi:hypothetical protein
VDVIPAQVSPVPGPAGGASTSIDVLIWVGALIVALLLLGTFILLVRKRLFTKDSDEASSMLNELRRMHKAGEMTTAEYDAARKSLTTRLAAKMPETAPIRAPRRSSKPAAPIQRDGELHAAPGFDLTGAPLPSPPAKPGAYDRKPPNNP